MQNITLTIRTVEEIRKKWTTYMSSGKKTASNNCEARKTGSGPPEEELTPLQDTVVSIIGETPIEGLEGRTDTGFVPFANGREPNVLYFTFPTCQNSRRSTNSAMENGNFLYKNDKMRYVNNGGSKGKGREF